MFNLNIQQNDNVYIYYDEINGNIIKISNNLKKDDVYKILEIPRTQVQEILEGRKKIEDFKVSYDTSLKQTFLVEITIDNTKSIINDILFEIKQIENHEMLKEEYKGISIDVWYKDLDHLEGQHVFYQNNIYKSKKYIPSHSEFKEDDYSLIISNVKIYMDSNNNLNFCKLSDLKNGDLILNYNKLYTYHNNHNADLFILKDKNYYVFKLNEKNKDKIKKYNLYNNTKINFSITKKHDPNILFRLISFSIHDLLEDFIVNYQYDFEFENKPISIYTTKYFDSYSYGFINE